MKMFQFFKNLFSNNNSQIKQLIAEGAYLVDVRSHAEFSNGNVSGSVNIPVNTLSSNIQKLENKKHIIVFCASGMRSNMAKSILKQAGFTNVTNAGTWNKVNKIIEA